MPEESTSKLFLDSSNEDAEEVFLFMHGKSRVSRSVRAKWLFDHMGQKITIDEIADRVRNLGFKENMDNFRKKATFRLLERFLNMTTTELKSTECLKTPL
jgi:hypothetical protein